MARLTLVSISLQLLTSAVAASEPCAGGIACSQLDANNMTFDCRIAGADGKNGDVMLLHGFPERASMYDELMRQLAQHGFRSVACDQRGYSPGASPPNEEDYMYHLLRDDVFAVADVAGFKKFHLIGHDHGALLGWYTAGSDKGKQQLSSYTGMSVPHIDAFAAGLYGPDADEDQAFASQYFSMFLLNNSASLDFSFWYHAMGSSAGFNTASDFQKALWWYNGAINEGVFALPKQYTSVELTAKGQLAMAGLRAAFGINPDFPTEGVPQKILSGDITMPAMLVCGTSDTALLCNHPYAKKTASYCKAGYTALDVDCGHQVLDCPNKQAVIDGVIKHVTASVAQDIQI